MDNETLLLYQAIVSGVSSFMGTYFACRYMTRSFEQLLQEHKERMEPLFQRIERDLDKLNHLLEVYSATRGEFPKNPRHVIDAEYRTLDAVMLLPSHDGD